MRRIVLPFDNIAFHRGQKTEQLIFFLIRHLELIERRNKVFNEGIEVRLFNTHALVNGFHVLAGVSARSARSLTDLFNQFALEGRNIGVGEKRC